MAQETVSKPALNFREVINNKIRTFADEKALLQEKQRANGTAQVVPANNGTTDYKDKIIHKIDSIKVYDKNGTEITYSKTYNEANTLKKVTYIVKLTDDEKIEDEKTFENLNLNDFDFIKNDDSIYKIDIPNLTSKEIDLINKNISDDVILQDIIDKRIATEREIEKHKNIYKYLPNFYNVRL